MMFYSFSFNRRVLVHSIFFGFLINIATAMLGAEVKTVPGENYLVELHNILQSAKRSVTILHFNFFTENGETRKIAEYLKSMKRQRSGLAIDLVLEGEKDADTATGAAARNLKTKELFAGSGVNVHFISGLRQNGMRPGVTHAKAVVVDDVLLSGSTNLTNTSLTKNNEFNLMVRDPKIASHVRSFIQALVKNSTSLISSSLVSDQVKILTDRTYLAEALGLINQTIAGESLYIATYFFRAGTADDRDAGQIFDAIVQAKNRGVKIKLFLERNNNPQVNPDITNANLQVAKKLSDHGIDVYFDANEKISHAKMILVDGKKKVLLQGSTNLFRGDLNENHQINIRVEKPEVVAKSLNWLMAKIAYEATPFRTLTTQVPAPQMFRMWFGYGQNRNDLSALVEGVNGKLIPGATQYAKGRGLEAYLPALINNDHKYPEIPDEIAIIAYKNAEMYEAARITPPHGPLYGPLHFVEGLFVKETDTGLKSGSAVAKPFVQSGFRLEKGVTGYVLGTSPVSWQQGKVSLYLLKNKGNAGFSQNVLQLLTDANTRIAKKEMEHVLAAVDADHGIAAVWVQHKGNPQAFNFAGRDFEVVKKINYTPQVDGRVRIGVDQGANIQFDSALFDTANLMKPILRN